MPSPCPRLRSPFLVMTIAISLLLLATASSTFADSATWKTNPGSGDWNTASNWTPPTIPNGPSDTATFASSNTTGVFVSTPNPDIDGIMFDAGASAFTITVNPLASLQFEGIGITNNSGITQNFVTAVNGAGNFGDVVFLNSATAGSQTVFTINGETVNSATPSFLKFSDSSTAGNSTIITNGPTAMGFRAGQTLFFDSSTAGNAIFMNNGSTVSNRFGGITFFSNRSTAGNGTFTNKGGTINGAFGGRVDFFDNSNAGNAMFINEAPTVSGAFPGVTVFERSSSAGNCTIVNDGSSFSHSQGGVTGFVDTSTTGHSTLIAMPGLHGGDGGRINIGGHSTGGTSRVQLNDGTLELSFNLEPTVSVGSIEGNGVVRLAPNNLNIGSNNLNTTFSGTIIGNGGSLTKVGTGKLVLRHANTYTGGTTIKRGKLVVNNRQGSGTGSGPVQVDGGWLGGKGIIGGAVTVGTGSGFGAVLAPGYVHGLGSPGALTIQSALTFSVDATYNVDVNSSNATADEVVANGVTINSGAQFSFADLGSGTLTPGTVFTVINNTAATPIAGTFSNLPDGSIFTSNGNTYQVSYQGGDGNDLTLTVIP